jgi:predicted enzyme related to lactoylglutathione lyase
MNKGPSYFEIQAEDINQAKDFYTKIFGWKFTETKGLSVEYWRIETDGSRGGMLKRPAPVKPMSGTNAFTCSMEVNDFDKVAEKIIKAGGQVALPKFAVPGVCWQGYFLDTEGNVFGLFQADSSAK